MGLEIYFRSSIFQKGKVECAFFRGNLLISSADFTDFLSSLKTQ